MNRYSNTFFCWIVTLSYFLCVRLCEAQVTVGTAPNSATVKVDWPTVSYAAIDVSSDVQGDNDVDKVLLGEDGTVAFSYYSSSYQAPILTTTATSTRNFHLATTR